MSTSSLPSFSLSILPSSLSTLETILSRLFLLLAFLTIGPWLGLIIYDFLLWLFRISYYSLPHRPATTGMADRGSRSRALSGSGDAKKHVAKETAEDEDVGSKGNFSLRKGGQAAVAVVEGMSRGARRAVEEEERDMGRWDKDSNSSGSERGSDGRNRSRRS